MSFSCLVPVFFLGIGVSAQSKMQLENEKKQNLKKIAETHKILQETSGEKKATLGKLNAISAQISTRRELINSINREIKLLDEEIAEIDQLTESIEEDLVSLKKEYAALIYATAKANKGYHKLMYLFASSSFRQLFARMQSLQQYTKARQLQKVQIEKAKQRLEQQRKKRNEKRYEEKILIQSQDSENKSLTVLQIQHSEVVKQLSEREEELKKEIEDNQKNLRKIDQYITELLEKELKKVRETEKNRPNITKNTPEVENPRKTSVSESGVASSFAGLKSRMDWPVQSGFVAEKFGVHPHPTIKGISVRHAGVVIQTSREEIVRCVFDGKVFFIGDSYGVTFVIVEHESYFTVYRNLKNVSVKAKQAIKAHEIIGQVSTDNEGIAKLEFQVGKDGTYLDPENWLSGR
ncbi:MAG: peptidoglycan DD-metalloendopeptidase family protein [Verrucomicrobia bacterium]|nr:peptidoglycan DD-metalloendopeptidase family protein [Cytophagales bacterium]